MPSALDNEGEQGSAIAVFRTKDLSGLKNILLKLRRAFDTTV
jgi:hypothetical protein